MKHGLKNHPGEHDWSGKKAHDHPTHEHGHKHLAEGVRHLKEHHAEVIVELDRSHEHPHKRRED
jgi:hypothetical protein